MNIEDWPRDPANGRFLCSPERPMPKDATGMWSHTGTTCTGYGDYADYYKCNDCGQTWSEELPE